MARHAATNMQTEPAAIIGAISTAVASILALLVAFGLDITQEQQVAILAVVAAVGPIVVALLIRPKVVSPATADKAVNEAVESELRTAAESDGFNGSAG